MDGVLVLTCRLLHGWFSVCSAVHGRCSGFLRAVRFVDGIMIF